jgi:oligopeptidase B
MTPADPTERSTTEPPAARREPVVRTLHGIDRVDPYAWLRDTTSPEVLAHLAAERAWYDAATSHSRSLVETLTAEMSSRVPPADRSVSWRRLRRSYYTFTPTGREYPQLLRVRHGSDGPAASDSVAEAAGGDGTGGTELLLDPSDAAAASGYVELGVQEVSPDERWLAYSLDTTGDEVYQLRFRDLDTGVDLGDVVPRSYYTGAWSADSGTFFYTVHDDAYRPHQVWRHRLGSPVEEDVCVLEEPDARFELTVRQTRSGDLVVLTARSRETTEVWLVEASSPAASATCVEPRRRGIEYDVEHARLPDGRDVLLIITNDGATEFRLMQAPLGSPGREHWQERIGEVPEERLHSVDAFAGALVLSLRRDGSPLLRVLPLDGGTGFDLQAPPAGRIALGRNELWDTDRVTVMQESATSPPTWEDVDLRTGARTVRHRQEAPGHDPDRYLTQREDVVCADGTAVPVTVTRLLETPLDGTSPCVLWGYGAYESCDDPMFDPALFSLLDRGVVHVQTHPRGGGERGRWWWLDGRMQHKQHTFDDHAGVAEYLAASGLVDPDRIATRGLSAGGLLQGAVFSQHPQRWRAVVAEVPFVDVVTTMLDPSVPLTVTEWDEWGDPRRPEDFAWMLAYSPYDNLPPAGGRPDLLVTGALHDPRVLVSEPAKWVAALRAGDSDWSPRCLFRVETGAGAHTGPAGRYAHLGYEAEVAAWLLERLDVS